MDINSTPIYTEELLLGELKPKQFMAIAQQAVALLGWRQVTASEDELVYDNWEGEMISIKVRELSALFTARSADPYYQPDNTGQFSATRFKQAVAHIIAKKKDEDRKLKYASQEAFGALVPSKTYIVTPILIYLNVLVFLAMVLTGVNFFSPTTDALLAWGGNMRSNAMNGEWWRLFTYMFLHGGIVHLLANSFALLYIGMFLEPLLGRFRFTAAYLLSGICAGLMSIGIHGFSVGVGASGAIFGLYGVFMALLTTNHIEKTVRKTMIRSILFFVVYNLMMGLQGNTDNAAHIGGLVSGVAIGFAFWPSIKGQRTFKHQLATTILTTVATAILSFGTLHMLSDDMTVYEKKMKQFFDTETKALEVTTINPDSARDLALSGLHDRGIGYWRENIKTLNEIGTLDLPTTLKAQNIVLGEYCRARIKQYELMSKKIRDNSSAYDDSLRYYSLEIDRIVNLVKGH